MLAATALAATLCVLSPAAATAAALSGPPVVVPGLSVTDGNPRVLVIAVPDLRWDDLADMPRLRAFAASASVGNLSVKTAESRADCADGLLTFNAGDRVGTDIAGCSVSGPAYAKARHDAANSSFGAQVGAFGHALRSARLVTDARDPQAVPLLADGAGQVDSSPLRTGPAPIGPTVAAVVDDDLYRGRPDQRVVTAGVLDQTIGEQLGEAAPETTVVVAGLSDAPTGHAHLHVLLIRRPGWGHVELARPSTPPPYVQLIDLAPTLLWLLDVPVPAAMAGRALHPTATPARDWTAYADQDRHAQAARSASKPLRYSLALLTLVVLLLLLLAGRGVGSRRTGPAAMWLARLVVAVPVTVVVLQLTTWWRWSAAAVAAAVAAGAVLGAVLVTLAARRSLPLAVVAVPAVTMVVLLVDQLAGGPLQLSAPLGDSPLIAGRFHGMGNVDFAVFATAALLCAGIAGGGLVTRGRRTAGVLAAAGIGLLALVVDGAPPFGDDAGGAVALLPAVAVLVAMLLGVRVTWQRLLLVVGLAVLAVFAVGALDHARGSGVETHLGRFVGQLLHGSGGGDVRRRATAVARSLGTAPFTVLVVVALLALVAAREPLRRRLAIVAGLPAAAAALATVALLGSLLNDSGVVVAVFALVVAVGAVVGAGALNPTLNRALAPAPGAAPDRPPAEETG